MQDTVYVGVDAPRKRRHNAVMDRDGTLLKSVDIPSRRAGVAGALHRYYDRGAFEPTVEDRRHLPRRCQAQTAR